jgi:integrin beta 3
MPVPLFHYRGVWEAGKTYPEGAAVTWDGKIFVAKTKTFNLPTEGADWQLAVHRGKQGKEGKQGAQGPEGKQGPQGPEGKRGPKGDPVGV